MVAFPLFIIAGGFIKRGGIGEHLVNFVNLLLGRVKGGLAMMMSVCCGIFGAISGSPFAAETVIGELMIPRMNKAGYDTAISSSLLASTCMLGSFIPPSGMMLVFCWLTNQPLLACFLATMIPGIVMMIAFCVWSYFKFKKDPNIIIEPTVAKGKRLSHAAKVTWKSLPALFFPIFVLGAIYGGICTPSEAAAVSVFYAAFVGLFVYKKINFKDSLPEACSGRRTYCHCWRWYTALLHRWCRSDGQSRACCQLPRCRNPSRRDTRKSRCRR